MSEALDTTEDETPRRARRDRAEVQGEHRRRRTAGSLNRMVQFKLDIFGPEDLDPSYVYYWFNDEGSNLRQMTQLDDYDFVTVEELGEGFNPEATDSESSGRVRMLVGNQKSGAPMYAYLCKKPRAFWEADQDQIVRNREDMMAGRVYRAEATDEGEQRPGGAEMFYAPASNQIGHAAQRRRGPVPRTLK
jgi:hypothetical protein